MKRYSLEITVFINGAVIMILEIAGSRVLSPYVGGSTFVWTSLIGIILGSLSIGYYLGGKIADKKQSPNILSFLILISAFFIGLLTLVKAPVLNFIQNSDFDLRSSALIATFILFTVPSVFLGMISPYAIRLKMKDVQTAGATVGSLYAISTVGSIVGTFLAGFVLIAYFGITNLLLILAGSQVINSFFPNFTKTSKTQIGAMTVLLIATFFLHQNFAKATEGILELNTQYNDVRILETIDRTTKRPIKLLEMNSVWHSAIFLDSDDLVFQYTKFYRLAKHFHPNLQKSLIIGGGAYSYPKDYLKNFPDATLDVVEIDPKLTELAKEHFGLREDPRLRIFHQDGRTFLNKNTEKYNVIFLDAFGSSYSIPYQLTTLETVEKIHQSLTDDGVVLLNIISAIDGEKGKFLRAEYHTFKEIFPQVYLFPVQSPFRSDIPQNILLVAFKSTQTPEFTSEDPELASYLQNLYKNSVEKDLPVLTDDFAPVDQYIMELI